MILTLAPEPILSRARTLAWSTRATILVVLDEHGQWLTPADTPDHRREFAGQIVAEVTS